METLNNDWASLTTENHLLTAFQDQVLYGESSVEIPSLSQGEPTNLQNIVNNHSDTEIPRITGSTHDGILINMLESDLMEYIENNHGERIEELRRLSRELEIERREQQLREAITRGSSQFLSNFGQIQSESPGLTEQIQDVNNGYRWINTNWHVSGIDPIEDLPSIQGINSNKSKKLSLADEFENYVNELNKQRSDTNKNKA